MNNELGRKITSLTLMTIMVAGGLTFAIPGVMPEAMAANANLFVSAENSQFDNRISGPQVVEVVIIDTDINETNTVYGEPDVTINGKQLRMAQATDGNWYAYFAEVEAAQYADYAQTGGARATGTDFGTFCRASDAADMFGFSIGEAAGIAVNSMTGTNGTSSPETTITTACANPSSAAGKVNNTINVVREQKGLNLTLGSTQIGQIGFNNSHHPYSRAVADETSATGFEIDESTLWPFIQLYDFAVDGTVVVTYNKGGGAQTATFSYGDSDNISMTTDRAIYPQGAEVHVDILDNWLNIDPTDEDSWTFETAGTGGLYYGVYDEAGSAVGGAQVELSAQLDNLLNSDALLTINQSANGNDVIDLGNTNNGAVVSNTRITFLETGVNTGHFTSYDESDNSAINIRTDAARGNSATISYDDSPVSIVVQHSFGTLSMDLADDEWNSGETIDVTLVDNDANLNSLSDEDLDVENVNVKKVPTLTTGDPFTLGEGNGTLQVAFFNVSGVSEMAATAALGNLKVGFGAGQGEGNGTGLIVVDSFSQRGIMSMEQADATNQEESSELGVKAFLIDLETTMAELRSSINTSTSFHGTNIFAYNVQSLINSTQTVDIYLINQTQVILDDSDNAYVAGGGLTNNAIQLINNGTGKGSVELTAVEAVIEQGFSNAYSSQNLGLYVVFSGTVPIFDDDTGLTTHSGTATTDALTFDFTSFGFTNSGEDASERTANQIVRLELEETGDNTGVFVGTLEYLMVNQLNIHANGTYTGLVTESDEVTFIAIEDLTDEDSPRVNYLDLGRDGVYTQIADQVAAPSHSGVVSFDSEAYKVADTVTVTLEDADLNTNSDLIDIFTTVSYSSADNGASDADRDQVGADETSTTLEALTFGSLGRLLDITFDDARWQRSTVAACNTNLANSGIDNGLAATGFTLVETGTNTGVFVGDFQIPSKYCTSDGTSGTSTTGVDIEVNYVDFRDASGEIIEVGDGAAIRANTGSISLDRTVYPVPFGTTGDYTSNSASTPSGRSLFPIHQTGMAATTQIAADEYITNGDLTIHIRVNDPDYDVSASGEDSIAVGTAASNAPVKISVIRGSETVILGYAGTAAAVDGTIDTNNASLTSVKTYGPMTEIAPDAGIFEADITIRYTDGPDSSKCPTTNDFTPLNGVSDSGTNAVTTRFDEAAASGENYCILQGDILQVEYTDATDASGESNTVTDSATFDLRNAVLQSDKSVYIIGSDIILTLIEPDFDLDNDAAETYDLDIIEWDSDAATVTVGGESGSTAANETSISGAFDPEPSAFRETGDSTGIFQVVLEMPAALLGTNLERGEAIDLEYTDWGPSGADYVGSDDEDVNLTIYTSNFGATVELDQKVYTWTDKVYITIVAPDHNFDSNLVDEIGDTTADHIKISTRGYDVDRYKLVETGVDTGIFTGEIILAGYAFDADGDGVNNLGVHTTSADGTGPTDGFIETSNDDGLTVSFEYSEDETVVGSALIRWNIGEAQWLEASYPASGTGVVRIIDPDMNLDPEAVDNFKIDVWSDSDAGGINLTVNETNEATGIFEGTVFFTVSNESSGHRLRVSEGDTVTASYEDNTLPDPYTTADELDITATTLIGTVVPPLERAPAANLRTVDAFGNSLDTVSVDQQVQISADLANGQDREQAFAYLVQIQDENGVTVSLAWITGSLSAGQSFSPALSWIPSEAGTYTATAFVWESVDNPTALSPPVSTTVNVR